MDERQLRQILLGVLNCSLLAGSSGCGNSTAPVTDPGPSSIDRFTNADVRTRLASEGPVDPFWPDLPLNEFVTPACDGSHWRATSGLHPQSNVDYAGLYAAVAAQGAVANGGSARAVSDGYQVVRLRDDDTTCPALVIRELWHVGWTAA